MEGIPGKEKLNTGSPGRMAVLLARQEAQAKGLLVQRSGQCTGDCAGHCPDRGRNRRAAACGKVGYAFAADRSCGGPGSSPTQPTVSPTQPTESPTQPAVSPTQPPAKNSTLSCLKMVSEYPLDSWEVRA